MNQGQAGCPELADILEFLASLDLAVPRDYLVQVDTADPREHLDIPGHQVPAVYLVIQELVANLEPAVLLDSRDSPAHLVTAERLELAVILDKAEHRENLGPADYLDTQGLVEHRE